MTKKFALAVARTAHIRVQLLAIAIEEVQAALQYDMITPEFAAAWLADIGALAFVNVEPFTNNLAATE
jgi:hypothetical protein